MFPAMFQDYQRAQIKVRDVIKSAKKKTPGKQYVKK